MIYDLCFTHKVGMQLSSFRFSVLAAHDVTPSLRPGPLGREGGRARGWARSRGPAAAPMGAPGLARARPAPPTPARERAPARPRAAANGREGRKMYSRQSLGQSHGGRR